MSTVSCLLLFAHHPAWVGHALCSSAPHAEPPMGGSRAHLTCFYARAQLPSRLFSLKALFGYLPQSCYPKRLCSEPPWKGNLRLGSSSSIRLISLLTGCLSAACLRSFAVR